MSANLSGCPFCGSDVIHKGIALNRHYRECQSCLARVDGYLTAEEADAAWNRRAKIKDSLSLVGKRDLAEKFLQETTLSLESERMVAFSILLRRQENAG